MYTISVELESKLNKESPIFLHLHMANEKIKQQLGCFVIHQNLNEDKSLEEETLKY